jgi:hypothetical protein
MLPAGSIPIPLSTIRLAFREQGRRVDVALRTQVGDAARLGEHRLECLRLLSLAEQVNLCCCFTATPEAVMHLAYSHDTSRRIQHYPRKPTRYDPTSAGSSPDVHRSTR